MASSVPLSLLWVLWDVVGAMWDDTSLFTRSGFILKPYIFQVHPYGVCTGLKINTLLGGKWDVVWFPVPL